MKPEIERAMREVLEAWETPETLACAIYQMKRIYMAAVIDQLRGATKKIGRPRKHSRHNRELPQPRTRITPMTAETITTARISELATALDIAADAMARLNQAIASSAITAEEAAAIVNETLENLQRTAQ
jgi:hypothetical protein